MLYVLVGAWDKARLPNATRAYGHPRVLGAASPVSAWLMRDTRSFFLVLTNHTRWLTSSTPSWGDGWDTMKPLSARYRAAPLEPLEARFLQRTHCCDAATGSHALIKHAIVRSLARHPARTSSMGKASACVVAAPGGGKCEAWQSLCPTGRPLFVIDVADADDLHSELCPTLWRKFGETCASPSSIDQFVYRVVSSPAVLARKHLARCKTLTVPWASHARSPFVAVQHRVRAIRIAFAGAVSGHVMADRLGFSKWRRHLREACGALQDTSNCSSVFQSMAGGAARSAVELYSQATFCLQPPGDTIVRSGIVDALSVGCVPVLFHPAQAALWPDFWPPESRILFDWSVREPDAGNASSALRNLLEMPEERVRSLQTAVAAAARRMFYRGEVGPADQPDAVDVLVESILGRSVSVSPEA